ncbi:Gp49 family protein [Bacillus sp. COPE52]|uniref:Gp49 family protein n=1 Tax=Bacillus sp. COPE52 TaxID=2233998 RepID=UPI000E107A45|nr:Gp49 family protein [Bacillus sp. COPE52]AXK19131.1 hypothetical protein DPQ31_16100 [Bacillus sp. COPE52]
MRNTVTKEEIDKIMEKTHFVIDTYFNKTTVVLAKLPNGFIICESSSCVDPANYDEQLGFDICKKRIENKVWELEGYRLQCEVSQMI